MFALACVLSQSARAQDVGDVALRTVNSAVASNVTCTGSAQTFRTNQGIGSPTFINVGQTSHLATATSTASAFQMEIDGIDTLNNVFRLSDLQLGVPTSAKGGLVVTAAGYMPNIQISVTCTAGATFSISYSGSFSPQPPNISGPLLTAIDKLPFQTAAANTSASTTFQSPTGNSQGTLIFQYAAAGPSGSTLSVQCISNAAVNLSLYTFSLTTVSTAQLFQVPASTCPFVTLSYASGGASATTYNLEYVFNGAGTTNAAADPCASSSVAKQSASVSISTATTTQIIPLTAGQTIYVCGGFISMATNGSATETAVFEYGTGASCGTGTTTVSGPITSQAAAGSGPMGIVLSSGITNFSIPAGNALCIVSTGTTVVEGGWLIFVKQ